MSLDFCAASLFFAFCTAAFIIWLLFGVNVFEFMWSEVVQLEFVFSDFAFFV